MVTVNEYLKNMLIEIVSSHKTISGLKDNPGDLDVLKKEISKITGVMNVLLNKIKIYKENDDDFNDVEKAISNFLENYYFLREIEIMTPLYSEDQDRIRNIRSKILDALNDKKLIEKIELLIHEIGWYFSWMINRRKNVSCVDVWIIN